MILGMNMKCVVIIIYLMEDIKKFFLLICMKIKFLKFNVIELNNLKIFGRLLTAYEECAMPDRNLSSCRQTAHGIAPTPHEIGLLYLSFA